MFEKRDRRVHFPVLLKYKTDCKHKAPVLYLEAMQTLKTVKG